MVLRIERYAIAREESEIKLCGLMTHYAKREIRTNILRHIPDAGGLFEEVTRTGQPSSQITVRPASLIGVAI
jgi:hypothetical protein